MYPRLRRPPGRRLLHAALGGLLATALATTVPLTIPAPADSWARIAAPAEVLAQNPALISAADSDPALALAPPADPATLAASPVLPADVPRSVPDDDGGRHLPAPPVRPQEPTIPPPAQATSPTPTSPPAAPPWTHIVIRAGDTLWDLAGHNGTTIDALMTVNDLQSRSYLQVGQTLYIPPPGWTAPWRATATDSTPWPVSLPALPAPATTYTVRAGDTLSGIAARFAVTVDTLVGANRLPARNFIRAGQVLSIPGPNATAPAPLAPLVIGPPGASAAPAALQTYTVQPGDSLSGIATRFGTTPDALVTTNGLPNRNRIVAGQTLHIPAPPGAYAPAGGATGGLAPAPVAPPAPLRYTVQPGDVLSVIAQRYGTTVDALVQANRLTSPHQIAAGQVLQIPAPGQPVPALPADADAADAERPVTSPPSIGPAAIDAVLASYGSPAAGTGLTFYALGVQYGIDPAYALAFFIHESNAGTRGVATTTHSIGNIRSTPGYPDYQGFRTYATWEDGIADWYSLIRSQYVDAWGLRTVSQIVPRYAPATENDVPAYIADVQRLVGSWAGPFAQLPAAAAGLRANLLPQAYHVTSEFGHYPSGGPHYGIDLDAPSGTAVTAPVGGVVVEVETGCAVGLTTCGKGWGNHVWWRSAVTGHYLLVAHFTTLNPRLAPGGAIAAGTLLGFSGSTGFSTGPHVHIQTSAGGPDDASAFDPSLELPWEACGHSGPHLGDAWGSTSGCN